MSYADITTKDPNPIKRFSQRRRFADTLSLFPDALHPTAVLDFGGGDGEL